MTNEVRIESADRVMLLVPHPDDESLAAGGLLQRARAAGAAVRVLFATDGENNAWTQRLVERRLRIGPAERERFGVRRRAEASAALAELGVPAGDAAFLGLPDQGITALLTSGEERGLGRLVDEIASFRPTVLVAPSSLDLHADHSGLAVLLRQALARARAARAGATAPAPRLLSYLVHLCGARPEGPGMASLTLTPSERDRKRRAVLCHATQIRVHRRKFLSFAPESETFYESDAEASGPGLHPVRLASFESGSLRLEIALRPRPGAWGRPTLLLAADGAAGPAPSLSVDLDWKAGSAPIRLHGASAPGAAAPPARSAASLQARLSGRRRGGLVSLPLAALPPADRLFVKIERPIGFFDEAGWLGIPASAGAAQRTDAASDGAGVCCVVPCYNVGALCGPVIREAVRHADHLIAVDDGSTDETGEVLRAIEAASGGRVRLIAFPENRGKGAALLEAFRVALEEFRFDTLVTIDGDGQHRPADIPRLAAACRGGAALAVGERSLFFKMPLRSRVGNTLTSLLLTRLYPGCPHDTQSGFRAAQRRFVERIVGVVRGRRYETELRILLLALAEKRRIAIVPIPTIYFEGNRSSHFRPLADSLRIGATIVTWLLSARDTG